MDMANIETPILKKLPKKGSLKKIAMKKIN